MFFSKKLKLITYATCLSIIILCIVECLSAMWFGTIAKNEYKKQFTFFSDSLPITVRNYSYQQGLFTSKEVVDFNINSGVLTGIFATSGSSESVVSIKLVTTVYNGIFAGLFTGHLVPTIAVAKSAIELQPSLDKTIKQIYANKEFLSWSNVMYLTRGGEIVISSPAVQYEEAVSKFSLRTSGFTFTSDYDSNYNGFNNTFKLGSLELGLNDVSSFKVSNIEYVSNSHYSANSLRVGSSKVSIDQIVLDNTDKILPSSFSLGSLASNILSINIGDFLPSSDSNNFDLQHLSYHNYSNDDGKYFSTDISVKLDKILLESTAAGPFVVKAKLSHVLSNKLNSLLESYSLAEKPDSSKMFTENLLPILSDSPVFSLESFNLVLPLGTIDVSGNMSLNGFESSDDYMTMLKQTLVMDAHVSMPVDYIRYIFVGQLLYVLSMNGSDLDRESREAINGLFDTLLNHQIKVWQKNGYINVDQNIISTNITLESGVAVVNNKKVQL